MTTQGAGGWGTGAPPSIDAGTTITPAAAASAGYVSAGGGGTGPGGIAVTPIPPTEVAGMTSGQIMALLHGLQPAAVAEAGQAHTRLGQTLTTLAGQLATHTQTLAENWSGQAADTALASLYQTHQQTVAVARAAIQAGAVLSWLGNTVLPEFKALPDPNSGLLDAAGNLGTAMVHAVSDASLDPLAIAAANATSAADKAAQGYLTALNAYLVEANSNLPTVNNQFRSQRYGLPGTANPAGASPGGPGSTSGTVPGIAGASAVHAAGSGGAGFPAGAGAGGRAGSGVRAVSGGIPGSPAPSMPGSPSLPGSLQGVPGTLPAPSSAVPGDPAVGGGLGSGTGGIGSIPGASSVPGLVVPGALPGGSSAVPGESGGVGEADGIPDFPGLGPAGSGMAGLGPEGSESAGAVSTGAAQDAAYGAAAGAEGGTAGPGLAGFPMAGAGAGNQSEKERQRHAWMYEDEDIWGGPTDCVPR